MSDDKITISMDEVNRATPVPGATPPPIFSSGYVPPESDQEGTPRRIGLYIGICIAVVALLCISGVGIMALVGAGSDGGNGTIWSGERTVSDYKDEVTKDINEELAKPDSKLKELIEKAHVTVSVTSAEIIWCNVTTFDGTDKAGKDDSNIDKVTMLIRFTWDGIVHKGGQTDLKLVYDVQNKRCETKIDKTTALVDEKSHPGDWVKLWYGVGAFLGELL